MTALPLDHVPLRNASFGMGGGDIFLDNVVCKGNEQTLIGCQHESIRVHNCNHSEDAGVICASTF